MKNKIEYHVFGALSFIIAFITYSMTIQPSVPFWDCGEFSAASIWQQVPHPPGAPLFLLFGKLFHLIIPFGDPGWRVNMVSVMGSAFTIWLLYLIIVKTILNFRTEPVESLSDKIAVFGAAFVGALSYAFSDTFWFNAVESEVYAISSLFVAVIIFLMMKWNEQANNPGHEKYLLLIAYLIGLSTGVHLLSILTLFSIVLLVYFRKYPFSYKSLIIAGVIGVIIFFVIYPGIVKWIPALLAGHTPFKNRCNEYLFSDSIIMKLLAIGVIIMAIIGFWQGLKRKNQMLSLVSSAFLLIILGYTSYTQILIRSNANSPMNENEPKNFEKLAAYLGREQYGEAPNWPRRYQYNDDYIYSSYEKKDKDGNFVYGKWIPPEREEVECKDGHMLPVATFKEKNFAGEMAYMWKYQIYHMFLRYFYWNFIGRESDVQDAEYSLFDKSNVGELNFGSGYAHLFPAQFYALR